jgi:hypothetical protein
LADQPKWPQVVSPATFSLFAQLTASPFRSSSSVTFRFGIAIQVSRSI